MAKVLGASGRYVSQEAIKQSRRIFLHLIVVGIVLGAIVGFIFANAFHTRQLPGWLQILIPVFCLAAVVALTRWSYRKLDALERKRSAMRRVAAGEIQVGNILADLPDDFCVVNDLATPFGNLDHVVVGPTGVFVLDTKNWRGVVSADGQGELLLNGQKTDKPYVRQFVGRMLGSKNKVLVLTQGLDPFYQAVFVFTAARVDARWGATGSVHCVRDDQLYEYIVEKNFGRRLRPDQVQGIAQAFLGLAHMDREFAQMQTSERTNAQPE